MGCCKGGKGRDVCEADLLGSTMGVQGQPHCCSGATTYYNLACLHASRDTEQCRMMLAKAEETGCLWQEITIAHVQQDSDLDPVRHLDWFADLLSRGKAQT